MITTFSPIEEAVAAIPRSEPRCIGHFSTLSGGMDFPISWADWDRDAAWAKQFLQELGISSGDFVAIVSTGHEAPWYGPILDAAYSIGATVCPLEPARYESGRADMFFRRFPITSIIGLDSELADALDKTIGLGKALSKVNSIIVRPEAIDLVTSAGLEFGLITPIGPALGLACKHGAALHINESEWTVAEQSDALVITNRGQRAFCDEPMRIEKSLRQSMHCCDCKHGHITLTPVYKERV